MRKSKHAKAASHARIVTAAASVMRRRGPERTSIADVMDAAGMTPGGFYRHFGNREAMLAAALPAAFEQFSIRVMQHLAAARGATPFEGFEEFYLSALHVADPAGGCPLAALGSDIARASPALRAQFGQGLRQVIAALSMAIGEQHGDHRVIATRQLATMVGAVILARASDPETGQAVLADCLGAARDAIAASPPPTA